MSKKKKTEPLELLGFATPGSLEFLMMRSACLTRVALTQIDVDAPVVVTSSSRFLHSAVCSCPDIGDPVR